MKKITCLLLLIFSFTYTKTHAQDSIATSADPWEKLYGYWYFEKIDSTGLWGIDQPAFVHKLYFSKDSIMASDFGSRSILISGLHYRCDIGTWTSLGNTIRFSYVRAVRFSTNTGMYDYINNPIKSNTPYYAFVIKSVDQEQLVVDIQIPKSQYTISTDVPDKLNYNIVTRTYKKVPTQVMK